MTGMTRALRLIAWLGARAAAGCSAPSSVWPRGLRDSGWEGGCSAGSLESTGGRGWDPPLDQGLALQLGGKRAEGKHHCRAEQRRRKEKSQ